ncbi:unnamed protein product [Didymodactylos carnosus]|uniref:Protein FAM136A n=1 Tax=Didymodactylos carnosus TaxID=1234261 RepID=A0A814PIU8_9BILA|nr:unnamed protein product [Didymodactylos carnosus]CAF1174347.1 unnamed protein product [Didymodactylos carnosus]CAF3870742.1 unnamed protein product [Didymodactylos carnosus]CAF3985562.1 unnamed protein product [Didymodactylos carnosus]
MIIVEKMEESQRKLNDHISSMVSSLHKNYLRKIYGDTFNCSYKCTEDESLDPVRFHECVERCSNKITRAEELMRHEMEQVQDRLLRCIRSCEDKAKDNSDKDKMRMQSGFETCVVGCANEILQLLPKVEAKLSDQLKNKSW